MNNLDKKLSVLYICLDPSLGGSTMSLFDLIESVRRIVYPIVLFPEKDIAFNHFMKHGIECFAYPFVNLYKFRRNRLIDVWRHPWRWHRIKKFRTDFGCALYIKKVLKGRKIDIVHTNTSPNNVGVYLSKLLKAKHIWQVRECLDAHAQLSVYGGRQRLIRQINHANARIAISTYVKNHWKMVSNNTFLIYDAVCYKCEVLCILPKDKYVLFASYNITEPNGSRKAISAFGRSLLFDKGFRLVMLGNCKDEYRLSLMDTAKEYHCENAIDFIPCQTDVKLYFGRASAFIMASENEGFGRVTAEAMFYGCPVIAHASGGTQEIVKDGVTGYLFNSIDECANLLNRVCATDQKQIINNAQDVALNDYSLDSYGDKVLRVYQSVLCR